MDKWKTARAPSQNTYDSRTARSKSAPSNKRGSGLIQMLHLYPVSSSDCEHSYDEQGAEPRKFLRDKTIFGEAERAKETRRRRRSPSRAQPNASLSKSKTVDAYRAERGQGVPFSSPSQQSPYLQSRISLLIIVCRRPASPRFHIASLPLESSSFFSSTLPGRLVSVSLADEAKAIEGLRAMRLGEEG